MVCRFCSRPVPADALRCPHCHWIIKRPDPVPAPPTCGGCARVLPADATYCPYCGWSIDIGEAPAPPAASPVTETVPAVEAPAPPKVKPGELYQIAGVPLTGAQKRELLGNIVGPPLSLIIFIMVLTLIPTLMGALSYSQVLDRIPSFSAWLLVFLLLVGAYGWFQSVRDLGRGIAYVQLTRLTGTSSQRINKQRRYYGSFEKVGKVAISAGAYSAAVDGAIYKITYSPVSKRAWSVELIEQPASPIPERDTTPLPH
jgi:RNA polymerase subunit RPABC4/transcription elongation factor Spt4